MSDHSSTVPEQVEDPNWPSDLKIVASCSKSVVQFKLGRPRPRGGAHLQQNPLLDHQDDPTRHSEQDPEQQDQVRILDEQGERLDREVAQDIATYGIAGRTWEAAYLLRHYLIPPDHHHNIEFDPPCPLFTHHDDPHGKTILVNGKKEKKTRTIVEIGSGTGYLSMGLKPFLDKGKDRLIVTDLEEVCPLLESNLFSKRMTEDGAVESPQQRLLKGLVRQVIERKDDDDVALVRPLPWGDREAFDRLRDELSRLDPTYSSDAMASEPIFDYVLASDLVYFPFLYPSLLRTLIWLTQPPNTRARGTRNTTKVMIGYKIRSLTREEPFWKAFGIWFDFEPVYHRSKPLAPCSSNSARNEPGEIDSWIRFGETAEGEDQLFVFVAERRKESYAWEIPEDDEQLMNGFGADDTFENLLLLGIDY